MIVVKTASWKALFLVVLGFEHAFFVELIGAMLAIKIAFKKGRHSLWLESDFMLVVQVFSSDFVLLPWIVRNRWKNCIVMTKSRHDKCTCPRGDRFGPALTLIGKN